MLPICQQIFVLFKNGKLQYLCRLFKEVDCKETIEGFLAYLVHYEMCKIMQ